MNEKAAIASISGLTIDITLPPAAGQQAAYVILLHGLARTAASMKPMARSLAGNGFGVVNTGYPSTRFTIETLAENVIPRALDACHRHGATVIHFVTHSMGGILLRHYVAHHGNIAPGRLVMLTPPNNGSEVVDKLKPNLLFKWLNGPAGQQLGTDNASLPGMLGTVDAETGIITGDRTVNPILSMLIPGKNDGKIAVANAQLDGMTDFLVIHAAHSFIMRNRRAIDQSITFLKTGQFMTARQVDR